MVRSLWNLTGRSCAPEAPVRTWWRHQMETFPRYWPFVRESTIYGGFPSQRPVTRSFDVFPDLRPKKRLSKQSRRRWFETPSRSLWRHCNDSERSEISEYESWGSVVSRDVTIRYLVWYWNGARKYEQNSFAERWRTKQYDLCSYIPPQCQVDSCRCTGTK